MRSLLASLLLVLLPFSALAQEEQTPEQDPTKFFIITQMCVPFDIAFATSAKYGEKLLFTGNGTQMSTSTGQFYTGGMFFLVNQETGSWSMLYMYPDGNTCLVGNGNNFKPYSGP